MDCGRCGRANRDGDRFCTSCGAAIAAVCPSCGAELPPEARFCGRCGGAVDVGAREQARAPTRKTVTVLFSDLVGSTALGERIDPETVRALMSPIWRSGIRRPATGKTVSRARG